MKILVTGATSGLGRNAVEHLLEQGVDTVALGRNLEAGKRLAKMGATFVPLDLTRATQNACARLMENCDAVWHCAARSSPWGERALFYQANVMATHALAQAAGAARVGRFVHISTPAVYFDFRHHYDVTESYVARAFASHYASTKYEAEQVITRAAALFPATTFVILRPRGLFGPHDKVILPRLLQQLRRHNGVLRLPRGGDVLLDITFVQNVVYAMALATHADLRSPASIYNVTNHQPLRLSHMLEAMLRQQLGLHYRLKAVGWPALSLAARGSELLGKWRDKEPPLTRYSAGVLNFDMTLSAKKAVDELGYRPRVSMEEAFALTGEWMRMNGKDNLF